MLIYYFKYKTIANMRKENISESWKSTPVKKYLFCIFTNFTYMVNLHDYVCSPEHMKENICPIIENNRKQDCRMSILTNVQKEKVKNN
jgi:hypothetical protein